VRSIEAQALLRLQQAFDSISAATKSKFPNFFSAFEGMDDKRSGSCSMLQMLQGFSKQGVVVSKEQLQVLCMRPLGDRDVFEWRECKSAGWGFRVWGLG